LIGEISKRGVSVLLVEQNLLQTLELTDVGYVLEEGKIITSGKGPELMEDQHVRQAYLGL
jgi:branched-chain amino acid transport system ATP-binding protein